MYIFSNIFQYYLIYLISLTQSAFSRECASGKLSSSSLPGKLDQKKPFQSGSSNI